ncbi:MAG TPA: CHASE3 domain-containing protein [Polyangiaceae bacterium]|nr:CHASE3 domain-containing protein [Polyangiaceae bacterium]
MPFCSAAPRAFDGGPASESNVSRQRLIPWLLALTAVAPAGLFWQLNTRWNREQQAAVRETLSARDAMAETLSLLKDAETGVRGFLLTDAPEFLEPHARALPGIEAHLARLAELARSDAAQQASTQRVLGLSKQKLELLRRLIERRRAGEIVDQEILTLLEQGKGAMDAIRAEIADMLAREDQRLLQRESAAGAASKRLEILTALALLGGIAVALGGLGAAQREAQRARALNQQLARDIAARSEAESALRQQSALQQLMLDNIGDAVVVIDPRRKALVINPAAQQILPFVSGEILPPDWLARSRAYHRRWRHAVPAGTRPARPRAAGPGRGCGGDGFSSAIGRAALLRRHHSADPDRRPGARGGGGVPRLDRAKDGCARAAGERAALSSARRREL